MINGLKKIPYKIVLLLVLGFTVACQDEELISPEAKPALAGEEVDNFGEGSEENSYAAVNDWIYSVMGDLYYWSDQLPQDPDKNLNPSAFFKSLQNSGDRFSRLVPDYKKLINSLNGVNQEAGYEYMLSRESGSEDGVVAMVLYTKHNSPAARAGVKRGDVISAVNGTKLNISNYKNLIEQTASGHTISYRRYNQETGTYVQQADLYLSVVELAENPSHLDTVLTVGNSKIGYYVYNFFSPGTNGNEYDGEMEKIFADFKSKGVNELVLDLRYNSGGAISSATTLGSLIGKGVDGSKIYYENRWNSRYQKYLEGRADGDAILRGRFKELAANIGNNLASGKLYVIVGSGTASASELLINGLKPYMDVYLIGEKTVGKNVGSVPVDDEENPENTYGILPIVLQVYNSLGFSDYENGFSPDALLEEFKMLPLRPLGEVQEPLLARAIQEITGVTASVKQNEAVNARLSAAEPLGSSLDLKSRTNLLIYDLPKK